MNPVVERALKAATDTKAFVTGAGVLEQIPALFRTYFDRPVQVIADPNTFEAAGRQVQELCRAASLTCQPPFVLENPRPHADDTTLAEIRNALAGSDAVPVAVGAGTINDLCKRAGEELGRTCMTVATAASVDGYAAFGAALSVEGFKKTVPCRAPLVIVADTDILAAAPPAMTAAGYADLAAKITGGSDWILADALGDDPVRPEIWSMLQVPLRNWLKNPLDLAKGDRTRLEALFEGLTLCGFGMQAMQSSRPASGAEHLFSHVWEMTDLRTANGEEPSHGFKVGIGTLAVTALTELFFRERFTDDDIAAALRVYPDWQEKEAFIRDMFAEGPLLERILLESRAKHRTPDELEERLQTLVRLWDRLEERIESQLIPFAELRRMLAAAGCPVSPEEIGLTASRVAATVLAAQLIRSRITILDVAMECGRLPRLATELFSIWQDQSLSP